MEARGGYRSDVGWVVVDPWCLVAVNALDGDEVEAIAELAASEGSWSASDQSGEVWPKEGRSQCQAATTTSLPCAPSLSPSLFELINP